MKLADWARQEGIDYKTAFRWFQAGTLPIPSTQISTGTILVHPPEALKTSKKTAIYARVSSSDQKDDLQRQLGRLAEYATQNSYEVVDAISEVGSGLNGKRPKLIKLLGNKEIDVILVEHKERLSRFGVEYIQALLESNNRKLVVMDETEITNDLVQDMIDILTSFCARLYGKRSAKNRAKKIVKDLETAKTLETPSES